MMGLIGNLASLLAGGSRYVPPPPPTTPQTGPDSTQTTASAPPVAEGTPSTAAATKTAANSTGDPSAMTVVQPSQAAPTAAAQSVPRQGTPADSSPISADFSLAPRRADEESARAFAIAAQARERLGDLVKGIADAPDAAPALTVVPAEKPEPANAGAGSLNSNLSTLRGENTLGTLLDKVA